MASGATKRLIGMTVVAFALFTVGGWAQECLHGPTETSQQKDRRMQALAVTRFVNTLEHRYKKDHGRLLALAELHDPAIVQEMGLTETFAYKNSSFVAGTDVMQGFELSFTLGEDSYSFRVTDKTDPCGFSFFSDQRAVIFEGHAIGSPNALTK
ncbi:MAG: hypothetical protein ABSF45_21555 [Terriglobia bacterium]